MKIQPQKLLRLGTLLPGLLFAVSLPAQTTLNYLTSAPTPGPKDIYNFTGSATSAGNVSGNDYVAFDQPSQGQTFTNGASAGKVTAIWVRHVAYTSGDWTWWSFGSGGEFTTRITNPSQAGTGSFVLDSETYTVTGSEYDNPGTGNAANGTGLWLRFGLTNGPTLSPNTVYGFDLTSLSGAGNSFFESWGTSATVYNGGAYRGSTTGTPDLTLNALGGDRVFLVEINGTFVPPTP